MHPVYKKPKLHEGIDYKAPLGTSVLAVADGVVLISKMQSNGKGYGNYIILRHDGFDTLYAHLSKRNVRDGQIVKAGQTIGAVGSTGDSTGNHLHFGICNEFNKRDWFDPMPYLKQIKGDDELVEKGKFEINGKVVEMDRILKGGKNYVELTDICAETGQSVDYDATKKMPIIKSK